MTDDTDLGPRPPAETADALWDDWDTPPRVPSSPMLRLDGYDGPLDLLLDLAQRQRIDLGRLSMVELAEQFSAALERLSGRVPVECRADWLVMAAQLMALRGRSLAPGAAADRAATQERNDLARFDAMLFVRAAAAWLTARPQLGRDVFARAVPPAAVKRGAVYVALMEACLVVMKGRERRSPEEAIYRHVVVDSWRVADAVARIRMKLAANPAGGELTSFVPAVAGAVDGEGRPPIQVLIAISTTLLAALELAREGEVTLGQNGLFRPVQLEAGH